MLFTWLVSVGGDRCVALRPVEGKGPHGRQVVVLAAGAVEMAADPVLGADPLEAGHLLPADGHHTWAAVGERTAGPGVDQRRDLAPRLGPGDFEAGLGVGYGREEQLRIRVGRLVDELDALRPSTIRPAYITTVLSAM